MTNKSDSTNFTSLKNKKLNNSSPQENVNPPKMTLSPVKSVDKIVDKREAELDHTSIRKPKIKSSSPKRIYLSDNDVDIVSYKKYGNNIDIGNTNNLTSKSSNGFNAHLSKNTKTNHSTKSQERIKLKSEGAQIKSADLQVRQPPMCFGG